MQIMTSKEAKNNFGELTKAMLREPVIITKNNKPIGAFVSMQDLDLITKRQGEQDAHDDWVHGVLSATTQKISQEGLKGKAHGDELFDDIMKRVRATLSEHA